MPETRFGKLWIKADSSATLPKSHPQSLQYVGYAARDVMKYQHDSVDFCAMLTETDKH